MVAGGVEGDGGGHGLEEAVLVDAGDEEAGLVEGFRVLRRGADADGGERMADAGEEAALLREGTGVGHYGECIHLKAVVVVEAEGLVLNDTGVKLKAGGLKTLA